MYVRPGALWDRSIRKRVAALCGQSYYGQSIAKANMEVKNQEENGTHSVSKKHQRRFVGQKGVVYPVSDKGEASEKNKEKEKEKSSGSAGAEK